MIKRLKAKYYDIPFEIKEYWPAYRRMEKGEPYLDHEALLFNTNKGVGDIVDVLHDYNLKVHSYKITRKYSLKGSDHVINPTVFDLQYHSTRKVKAEDYDVEDIDDFYTPELLRINQ